MHTRTHICKHAHSPTRLPACASLQVHALCCNGTRRARWRTGSGLQRQRHGSALALKTAHCACTASAQVSTYTYAYTQDTPCRACHLWHSQRNACTSSHRTRTTRHAGARTAGAQYTAHGPTTAHTPTPAGTTYEAARTRARGQQGHVCAHARVRERRRCLKPAQVPQAGPGWNSDGVSWVDSSA